MHYKIDQPGLCISEWFISGLHMVVMVSICISTPSPTNEVVFKVLMYSKLKELSNSLNCYNTHQKCWSLSYIIFLSIHVDIQKNLITTAPNESEIAIKAR